MYFNYIFSLLLCCIGKKKPCIWFFLTKFKFWFKMRLNDFLLLNNLLVEDFFLLYLNFLFLFVYLWCIMGILMPLSTIFQLYHETQFYWQEKSNVLYCHMKFIKYTLPLGGIKLTKKEIDTLLSEYKQIGHFSTSFYHVAFIDYKFQLYLIKIMYGLHVTNFTLTIHCILHSITRIYTFHINRFMSKWTS